MSLNTTITQFEKEQILGLCEWYALQVKDAIKNKPVNRRSVYNPDGFKAVVNATGALHDSVKVVQSDLVVAVTAFDYIDDVVFGLPPGKDVSLIELERWQLAKGLEDVSIASAKINIKQIGSSIWLEHQGANSGLLLDIPLQERIDNLKKDFATKTVESVETDLLYLFKLSA